MECVASISRDGRSTRCRIALTRRQRSASARRWQARMGPLDRSIRRIHSALSIGRGTRSRNSVSRWRDRASNPIPAVAHTPRRQKDCAAPCCSPLQTSCCERTSHRSLCLAVRSGATMRPGGGIVPASTTALHASLSSELFSLRQVVISSALGMNALQRLSTSGVHARRCSGVPCERAGEAAVDSKVSGSHHRAKGIGRSSVNLYLSMFIRGLTADIDTLLPERVLVAKGQSL
jgi:hypothetical protein